MFYIKYIYVNNRQWYDKHYIPDKFIATKHKNKLTQKQVDIIRADYATGKYSQQYLANKFGITQTAIGLIVNNKRWISDKIDNRIAA
jgi:DNA-binding MarR family transcriptional regulator